MSTKTKTKGTTTKKENLAALALPALWERFKEATGESTKSPNKKFLLNRIEAALAARASEPELEQATPSPAKRNARASEPAAETREPVTTTDSAPSKQRGRFAAMTIEELQTKYLDVVGRSTGSDDRRYLIWKIREAEKGRINVGPRKTRAREGEPLDVKILPLRLEADVADKMDEAWRSKGIKNRMEFCAARLATTSRSSARVTSPRSSRARAPRKGSRVASGARPPWRGGVRQRAAVAHGCTSGAAPAILAPMPGALSDFLQADHARLDEILTRAAAQSPIDLGSFNQFREGLLRHIAMEEKVLLPDARRRRGGAPLDIAKRLKADHAAIAALLVPTPTPELVAKLRDVLAVHNPLEEGPGGLYELCEGLASEESAALLSRIRAIPKVPVAPYFDGPRAFTNIELLLRARASADVT